MHASRQTEYRRYFAYYVRRLILSIWSIYIPASAIPLLYVMLSPGISVKFDERHAVGKLTFIIGSRATTSLGLPLGFATVLYLEVPDSN